MNLQEKKKETYMESTGLVLQEDSMTTYVVWKERTWKTRRWKELKEEIVKNRGEDVKLGELN